MNWMNSWNDLQKKMWSDWAEQIQKPLYGSAGGSTNPFEFLQKSMAGSAGPWSAFAPFKVTSPEEIARRSMIESMNNFMNMSKGVFDTFGNLGEKGAKSNEEWVAELEKNLEKFRGFFFSPDMEGFSSINPMGNWQKMVDAIPQFSGDTMKQYMEGLPGMQGLSGMDNPLAGALKMPGLGLNREKQEKMQKAVELGLAYQKVLGEYQTLMNKSTVKSAELFKERLIAMAQEGKPLNSLRDLHVLWIDCNEDSNAATVSSREYQELSPRLTTALFSLKQHVQSMTDDAMSAMNMPTRKELNSAYLQIHDLKKKVRSLESQVKSQTKHSESSKINRLRDDIENLDIDSLRSDVDELKRLLETSAGTTKTAPSSSDTVAQKTKPATTKPAASRRATKTTTKTAAKPSAKKGD